MTIATTLAGTMDAQSLSNRALEKTSGVSRDTIRRIRDGAVSPTLEQVEKLAGALDITAAALIGVDPTPAVPAATADGTAGVILRDLVECPLNPRKSFDPDSIEQLAASIAAQGLLQNLLLRPAAEPGRFEIVAGARRFRALCFLAEAAGDVRGETVDETWPVPARIEDLSDQDVVMMAIVENLQREEVPPLEEAAALAAAVDAGVDTEDLARKIGRTRRWVQQRVQLCRGLSDPAKQALATGEINLAQARALARAPETRQADVLDRIVTQREWGQNVDEKDVTEMITGDMIPVDRAAFDVIESGLEIFNDGDGNEYFQDADAFKLAQVAEAERQAGELRAAGWAWVEIRDGAETYSTFWAGEFEKGKKADGAGVIIELNRFRMLKVHTGLIKPKRADATATVKADARPKDPIPKALQKQARNTKTWTLQLELARTENRALPVALVVIGLLRRSPVRLLKDPIGGFDHQPTLLQQQILIDLLEQMPEACRLDADRYHGDFKSGFDWSACLDWLLEDEERLHRIFAALIATQVGSWNGHDTGLGDHPLIPAIARVADTAVQPGDWTLEEAYLKALTKPQLARVAIQAIDGLDPATTKAEIDAMKKGDAVKWILDHPDRRQGWIPPELHFADEKTVRARLGEIKNEEVSE